MATTAILPSTVDSQVRKFKHLSTAVFLSGLRVALKTLLLSPFPLLYLNLKPKGISLCTVVCRLSHWRSTSVQCYTRVTLMPTWLWMGITGMPNAAASLITTLSPQRCCSASASAHWRPVETCWWWDMLNCKILIRLLGQEKSSP